MTKNSYDGVILTQELRHLGSSVPWFTVSPDSSKGHWYGSVFRWLTEVGLVTLAVCYLATLL